MIWCASLSPRVGNDGHWRAGAIFRVRPVSQTREENDQGGWRSGSTERAARAREGPARFLCCGRADALVRLPRHRPGRDESRQRRDLATATGRHAIAAGIRTGRPVVHVSRHLAAHGARDDRAGAPIRGLLHRRVRVSLSRPRPHHSVPRRDFPLHVAPRRCSGRTFPHSRRPPHVVEECRPPGRPCRSLDRPRRSRTIRNEFA